MGTRCSAPFLKAAASVRASAPAVPCAPSHKDSEAAVGSERGCDPLGTCRDIYVHAYQGCSHKHNNYTHKRGLKLPFYENSNLDI